MLRDLRRRRRRPCARALRGALRRSAVAISRPSCSCGASLSATKEWAAGLARPSPESRRRARRGRSRSRAGTATCSSGWAKARRRPLRLRRGRLRRARRVSFVDTIPATAAPPARPRPPSRSWPHGSTREPRRRSCDGDARVRARSRCRKHTSCPRALAAAIRPASPTQARRLQHRHAPCISPWGRCQGGK